MSDIKPKWSLSEQGNCICIGSGLLFFANKKPQGINYSILLEKIKANPNSDTYQVKAKRRLTLGKAIDMNMLDRLGDEIEFSTTINIHTIIHDRSYDDLPQTGKELLKNKYESKPFEVDET